MDYGNKWENLFDNFLAYIGFGIVVFIVVFFIFNPPTIQEQNPDAQIATDVNTTAVTTVISGCSP